MALKYDPYIEDVNGIVIGEITRRVSLFTPDGKHEMGRKHFSLEATDAEYREWSEDIIAAKRAELGPVETRHVGYDKPWEMRIYG